MTLKGAVFCEVGQRSVQGSLTWEEGGHSPAALRATVQHKAAKEGHGTRQAQGARSRGKGWPLQRRPGKRRRRPSDRAGVLGHVH